MLNLFDSSMKRRHPRTDRGLTVDLAQEKHIRRVFTDPMRTRRSVAVLKFRLYFKPLHIPLNLLLAAAILFYFQAAWKATKKQPVALNPSRWNLRELKPRQRNRNKTNQRSSGSAIRSAGGTGETRSMAADKPDPSSGDGKNLRTCWICLITRRTTARPPTLHLPSPF